MHLDGTFALLRSNSVHCALGERTQLKLNIFWSLSATQLSTRLSMIKMESGDERLIPGKVILLGGEAGLHTPCFSSLRLQTCVLIATQNLDALSIFLHTYTTSLPLQQC